MSALIIVKCHQTLNSNVLFTVRTIKSSHYNVENCFSNSSYLHLYLSVFTDAGQEATNSKRFSFIVEYCVSKQAIAYDYYYLKKEIKH